LVPTIRVIMPANIVDSGPICNVPVSVSVEAKAGFHWSICSK
jgi:hypothetical protein